MKANPFRLDETTLRRLAAEHETPFVVVSLPTVAANYRLMRAALPRVKIHYAMKANPAERILATMVELGANFDVASNGEMEMLARLSVDGGRMIYANPVKTPAGLRTAARLRVKRMTFDDASEIPKMAAMAPASGCRRLFDEAAGIGIQLNVLDIGGGVPIPALDTLDEAPALCVLAAINGELNRLFGDEVEVLAEPGRFICGTAVNLVTSVIGVKDRDGQTWYTIDEGVYGTFSGSMYDHWTYDIESFQPGERRAVTVAGPSCDSIDVVRRDIMLPPLAVGDMLLVPNAGAYTTASATTFNGFPLARIVYME